MTLEFTCELDGSVMRADTDDEIVSQVERHIAEAHADLVRKFTRARILGMARTRVGEEQ